MFLTLRELGVTVSSLEFGFGVFVSVASLADLLAASGTGGRVSNANTAGSCLTPATIRLLFLFVASAGGSETGGVEQFNYYFN